MRKDYSILTNSEGHWTTPKQSLKIFEFIYPSLDFEQACNIWFDYKQNFFWRIDSDLEIIENKEDLINVFNEIKDLLEGQKNLYLRDLKHLTANIDDYENLIFFSTTNPIEKIKTFIKWLEKLQKAQLLAKILIENTQVKHEPKPETEL